jgi:hypothetical protein
VSGALGDLLAVDLRRHAAVAHESTTPHSTTSKDAAPAR